MLESINWAEAEKLGLALPLSQTETLEITSCSFRVVGALQSTNHQQKSIPLDNNISIQPPQDVALAANELMKDYSAKASIIASDRANMAWQQRDFYRRDFWVSVFDNIRKHATCNHVAQCKENVILLVSDSKSDLIDFS